MVRMKILNEFQKEQIENLFYKTQDNTARIISEKLNISYHLVDTHITKILNEKFSKQRSI